MVSFIPTTEIKILCAPRPTEQEKTTHLSISIDFITISELSTRSCAEIYFTEGVRMYMLLEVEFETSFEGFILF